MGLRFYVKNAADRSDASRRQERIAKGPRVAVAKVRSSDPHRRIILQGEARPFTTATLVAKVPGYLRGVRVDKGDLVREGDILALIETPEVDRQYQAAFADAENKRQRWQRAMMLSKRKLIAQQDADQALADSRIADRTLAAIAAQRSYQILRAPFSGQVIELFVDPGALVQATGAPIVTVAETGRLRILVYVDQRDAPFVHPGTPAHVGLPDPPSHAIDSKIARISGGLDRKSRTMLAEVDADNGDGRLVPYSFLEVALELETPSTRGSPPDSSRASASL